MAQCRYVLIGGFLGAGKTAAMLRLARHVQDQGRRAALITNDQSVHLVDTARVRAVGFSVREIAGGCFCCRFDNLVAASRELAARTTPDVLIAEPVGSCTDLIATVGYPLRHLHGADYELAPLSVLVDPVRCARILGLRGTPGFSEKVLYVYRKQLEEAELLVINKVDLLADTDRRALTEALAEQFPQARVLQISCHTGEGLAEWFASVLTGQLGRRSVMQVDYALYAAGEALLGWLNASARVQCPAPFDGNAWLTDLALRLRQQLPGIALAHLKMTLSPDEGPDLAAISLTGADAQPHLTHALAASLTTGQLTLNLRAEADPDILQRLVRAALSNPGPVEVRLETINAFRPGKPVPTHRNLAP